MSFYLLLSGALGSHSALGRNYCCSLTYYLSAAERMIYRRTAIRVQHESNFFMTHSFVSSALRFRLRTRFVFVQAPLFLLRAKYDVI